MANTWATPRTWVAANVLTAAQLNVDVRDNGDYMGTSKPNCRAFNSANISHTTSGTTQALTFDSERYDRGSGMHSTSVNTGRLTVPTGCGGVYLVGGCIEWASNITGYRELGVRLNGASLIVDLSHPAVNGTVTRQNVGCLYQLTAGDYVELVCNQNSGGALNVQASSPVSPEFWAVWQST